MAEKPRKWNTTLLSIFCRSFMLQTTWNFERMQNIGFVYALLPLIRIKYPDPEKRKEVLLRNLEFFNTNPYMVNAILGLVAAGEEDTALNAGTAPEELSLLKTSIAGPLAAIGDKFFWSTLRPFVALLSIAFLLIFYGDPGMKGSWLAPIFFVLTYNIIILPFRYWSMMVSYKYRNRIIRFLANIEFQQAINIVRYAGLSVALILVGYYFAVFSSGFREILIYLVTFIIFVLMADLRMPPEIMVYIALVISTGITLVVK